MRILINDKKHLPAAARKLLDHTGEKKYLHFTDQWGPGKQQ